MNFSKFFIDRPIFAGVLSVLIFVAGLLALRAMPISEYPEVVPPQVVVRAHYPGANPKVIADTVATPIEEQINGVEGMLYMSSQATTDGVMTLTVTFKLGTDPDKAQQLVQNRVAQAEPRLPEEVRASASPRSRARPTSSMVVHLLSPNDRYDMTYLRNYARAQRQGPAGAHPRRRREQHVRRRRLLDARLARSAEGRRARPVRQATSSTRSARRTCRPRPASSAPRPTLHGVDLQLSVNAQGRLRERGGVRQHHRQDAVRTVRSRACATSPASSSARPTMRCARCSTTSRRSRIGDLPGAGLQRDRDSQERPRGDGGHQEDMPEGVDYDIVYDTTQFVRASIDAVMHTLLEAMALVVLVVILFLQTWRASIIPLLAVPVSIIGTFAVMYTLGFSINALTLFGLVLAIGIVVDDAIVVVENVERNIEEGLSPRKPPTRR